MSPAVIPQPPLPRRPGAPAPSPYHVAPPHVEEVSVHHGAVAAALLGHAERLRVRHPPSAAQPARRRRLGARTNGTRGGSRLAEAEPRNLRVCAAAARVGGPWVLPGTRACAPETPSAPLPEASLHLLGLDSSGTVSFTCFSRCSFHFIYLFILNYCKCV